MDEGENFSKSEISTFEERTETVEETTVREGVWRVPEIPPPQTIMERDDDWFVWLDVVARETSYVPPGTAQTLPLLLVGVQEVCITVSVKRRVSRLHPH